LEQLNYLILNALQNINPTTHGDPVQVIYLVFFFL